jgi:hypothetical protein
MTERKLPWAHLTYEDITWLVPRPLGWRAVPEEEAQRLAELDANMPKLQSMVYEQSAEICDLTEELQKLRAKLAALEEEK